MFPWLSPLSPESVRSPMLPPSPNRMTNSDGQNDFGRDVRDKEKEGWSGDSSDDDDEEEEEEEQGEDEEEEDDEEEDVSGSSSKKEREEIDTHENGKEVIEQSQGNSIFNKSNGVLDEHVKRKLVLNDQAGIRMHKNYASLQIHAGGHGKLPNIEKDCHNHLERNHCLRLVKGDAAAMNSFFMKMTNYNSHFFYAMDFNGNTEVRNVFWADARSRAACKEFGDVVTFDTTYLVNKYNMPLVLFVGVNHHGQSILLGCGLIAHEDTKSFSWLFQTWMTCMWGRAPKEIITDQCMAMKNAIEEVLPNTQHRWCIRQILKKVPEKLGAYEAYKSISTCLHNVVYDSLAIEEFEDAWDTFIKKYELQNNEWLKVLYLERKRWVPAFLKDVLWVRMSPTQRSETMNGFFDDYTNSKTTLKQFLEQYENALTKQVESENMKICKGQTLTSCG